jgi:hypothetical protein
MVWLVLLALALATQVPAYRVRAVPMVMGTVYQAWVPDTVLGSLVLVVLMAVPVVCFLVLGRIALLYMALHRPTLIHQVSLVLVVCSWEAARATGQLVLVASKVTFREATV